MSAALDVPTDSLQQVSLLVSGAGKVESLDLRALYVARARVLFDAEQARAQQVGIILRAVEAELARLAMLTRAAA